MNNSSNKDQHYALDSSGNIRHIKDANPSNDEFFCLFCHRQMIAKQGKIRQWHFAHKALSPNCSYESYLHSLAKLLILQKLRSEQPFGVEIKVPFTCRNKETCIWYEDSNSEDWLLSDLSGLCRYLKIKDIPKKLTGKDAYMKISNLFEKKGKVYSKGYDAENIVQNINIDIILDKQKEALKPLRDLFIKDN